MRPLAALLAAVMLVVLAPGPAPAADPDAASSGLAHSSVRRQGASGGSTVHVLRARSGVGVRLRPVLAADRVGARETVSQMAERYASRGAVAGTNGGFWLRHPEGEPNGYFADAGRLVSEAETQGSSPRGTLLVRRRGGVMIDRLETAVTVTLPGGAQQPVRAVNRYSPGAGVYPDGDDPLFAYTPALGGSTPVKVAPLYRGHPVAAALVTDVHLPSEGRASGVVADARPPGRHQLAPATVLLVGHGAAAQALAGLQAGDPVTFDVELLLEDQASPGDVVAGLAGGPLILDDGQVVPPAGWYAEGFEPNSHGLAPHPRTAVGVRSDGQVLVVTVDGRQPGVSAGMHLPDLARLLADLGAVDAVSFDGGGSTAMVVDRSLQNRPSDPDGQRPVATGLFFFRMPPESEPEPAATKAPSPSEPEAPVFERTSVLRARDAAALAETVAATTHPDGAVEAVLVAGGAADGAAELVAAPLAVVRDAPLLRTDRDRVPRATLRALAQLQVQRVTVVGRAVHPRVVERLQERGLDVSVLGGGDDHQLSVNVAHQVDGGTARVFVVPSARSDRARGARPGRGAVPSPDPARGRRAHPRGRAAGRRRRRRRGPARRTRRARHRGRRRPRRARRPGPPAVGRGPRGPAAPAVRVGRRAVALPPGNRDPRRLLAARGHPLPGRVRSGGRRGAGRRRRPHRRLVRRVAGPAAHDPAAPGRAGVPPQRAARPAWAGPTRSPWSGRRGAPRARAASSSRRSAGSAPPARPPHRGVSGTPTGARPQDTPPAPRQRRPHGVSGTPTGTRP